MSEATVSVLIPAYNAQATLEETIRSALSQTYQPLEILVVDDASTDSTADLVLTLARSNPMIRLLRAPQNAGLSAARNLGIREARGSWIALLDADDVWASDKLAEQIKFAAGHSNLDVIGCYYQERFGNRLGAVRQELFWPSSLLIKRTVLLEVLFNPEWRSSEMPEFWSRFDLKYEKGGVTKPLMQYRLNLTGIAHRRFFKERMAWRAVGENTRRRRDGVPEVRYQEVEEWYRQSHPTFRRWTDAVRWRGDFMLREALFHAKDGNLIRAALYGGAGMVLNPKSLMTKMGRLSSLRRSA